MKQPIILHKDSNITVTTYPMEIVTIKDIGSIRNDLTPRCHRNQFTTEQMDQLSLCC